jgi:GcrA cell cycle regulator
MRLRTWTPAKVQRLRTLFASGLSAGQCAIKLGCSRNAAGAKLMRLGLQRSHKVPTAKPKIVRQTNQALTPDISEVTIQKSGRPLFSGHPPKHRVFPLVRNNYTKDELYKMLAEAVRNT